MNLKTKVRIPHISMHVFFILLLLIPFYKLLSIGSFQEQGFQIVLFKFLEKIYDGGRILAGTYGFYLFLKHKCKKVSSFAKSLVFFFLIEELACIVNNSIDVFISLKIYAYIGFVLLLNYLFLHRDIIVLEAAKGLFGFFAITAVITTMFFPYGFLHGDRVYEAVYFLGGKNASFPFYYMFLLCWFVLYTIKDNKHRLPAIWWIPIVLMIIAALICKSVNSLVALVLIAMISFLYTSARLSIRPRVPVTILLILLSMIYIGANIPGIENLLAFLGRNSTFSHRTLLWGKAFDYITREPIFGYGYKLEYSLGILTTDHAHSTFLDMFSKYGAVSLIYFLYLIHITLKNLNRIDFKPLKCYLGLFLLVYLFHMGFDDYNFNFEILILMILNHISFYANNKNVILFNTI